MNIVTIKSRDALRPFEIPITDILDTDSFQNIVLIHQEITIESKIKCLYASMMEINAEFTKQKHETINKEVFDRLTQSYAEHTVEIDNPDIDIETTVKIAQKLVKSGSAELELRQMIKTMRKVGYNIRPRDRTGYHLPGSGHSVEMEPEEK